MSSPLGPTNQTGNPSGTAPTVIPNANAGTTATAAVTAGSLDQRGEVTVASAGTGQAAGVIVAVTFAKPLQANDFPQVIIQAKALGTSESVAPYVTGVTPTGFNIATASAVSAAVTYTFGYVVVP